jgi:formylmethanofuran dehydrogenase subunit A
MDAAEGAPMHLAHVQFYAYGNEGPHGFSSAAARLIEGLRKHPNITIDVGQVLFGQTVTISGDVIAQFSHRSTASPKKYVVWDGECEGGGGVVPYRYRPQSLINALQWAIGLELFLLADDPGRVFFTTDHPNGAPFTRYPELIRLLMDREFRLACLDTIHPEARRMTLLGELKREFSLYDVAIMTRAAPAELLGLPDRGSLRPGSKADVAVYAHGPNPAATFAHCRYLLKDGELIIRGGKLATRRSGAVLSFTPSFDRSVDVAVRSFMDRFSTIAAENYIIQQHELASPTT